MRFKIFGVFYLVLALLLFLYSYTQVDLSLTLSKASIIQTIEKTFQNIGWYQRPVSTAIFVSIFSLMIAAYLYLLHLANKSQISRVMFWRLFLATSAVLVLSYNAFSYDLFSYIFHAKIVTIYHQNPYIHKALDFPGDPMLSFMRWTHNTYPYGPVWLAITIPLSVLGANIFLITMVIFKLAIGAFFVGSVWMMEKISVALGLKNKIFPLVLFAFNPLVIIECLVSSHNDIAMIFFALSGFYLFLKRKVAWAIALVIISYLVKSVTIFLIIPIALNEIARFRKIAIPQENALRLTVISLLLGLSFVLISLEIQPWYFLWVFPFIAFLKPNRIILSITISFTIGLIATYIPLIAIGNYIALGSYKLRILPVSLLVGLILGIATQYKAVSSRYK